MGETTKIDWTDSTFNPWIGCTKVSPGCDNCYAETLDHRWGHDSWGKGKPRRMTSDSYWMQPVRWDLTAKESGKRHLVFCASLADVMDDEAPEGGRDRLWRLIDKTPHLTWLLLTKRPHRYEKYLPQEFAHNNVWYGTTTENQEFFDVRFPIVKDIAIYRGGVDFISYEPALGPLSITMSPRTGFYYNYPPDWVIFGGESGANFRPCEVEWARKLRRECKERHVAYFVKQMSGKTPAIGKELIPADLLIHEYPSLEE